VRGKWFPLVLLLLSCALWSCGKKVPAKTDRTILCSFYPVYIATFNVARDVPGIRVVDMTSPRTGCLHDYQLTPDDMKRIEGAWVFVVNGAGMEAFLQEALSSRPDLAIVEANRGIPLLRDAAGQENPHVWVSITGEIQQVRNIGEQLAHLDSSHAPLYRANASRYASRLDSLRTRMHQALDPFAGTDIITFHEAFPYFADEFHLRIAAVIEREPGSEPSAGELAKTIGIVRSHKVRALFAEPQYPAKAAQTIARETGIRVWSLDPAVTGPDDPDAYLRIMESNLSTLRKALAK
jgi:zinc transport system substrate-binding protein